jgi:hypothetical protein
MLTFDSNHGTFYVNQLMALKLIVNDTAGATTLGRGYFGGIYKGQMQSNGNQVRVTFVPREVFLKTSISPWKPADRVLIITGTSTSRA